MRRLTSVQTTAKVGGPVQYRWMYHIERALRYLKPMVGNRARVEGCIAEAFTLKEVAYFSSVYFAEEHNVNAPMMWYNVDEESPCSDLSNGRIHYSLPNIDRYDILNSNNNHLRKQYMVIMKLHTRSYF
jgi:hypothetical protein